MYCTYSLNAISVFFAFCSIPQVYCYCCICNRKKPSCAFWAVYKFSKQGQINIAYKSVSFIRNILWAHDTSWANVNAHKENKKLSIRNSPLLHRPPHQMDFSRIIAPIRLVAFCLFALGVGSASFALNCLCFCLIRPFSKSNYQKCLTAVCHGTFLLSNFVLKHGNVKMVIHGDKFPSTSNNILISNHVSTIDW